MATRKGHSRGSSGTFRHERQNVARIKSSDGSIHEYQVGPNNVKLDGSNYNGASGATFYGIRKAIKLNKTPKVQVAVLIKRESSGKGFRWLQTRSRDKKKLLEAVDYAEQAHFNTADFAEMLLATDYPITLALTWRIIQVYA